MADLFILGVAPIDYSPILLLKPFGFRIAPDTLSSTGLRRWPARHYPCLWIQRPSSERRRDLTLLIHALPSAHYEAVRPSPTHRYFRPRGGSRLHLFPWHRRQGSHVPHRSLIELRAAYTPDAARSVSGHPPSLSRRKGHPAVLTSPNPLSTLQKQFACARLSRSCLSGSWSRRFRDAHDHGF